MRDPLPTPAPTTAIAARLISPDARTALPRDDRPKADAIDALPRTNPHCPQCGYLRRGLAEAAICPECGHDPAEASLVTTRLDTDAWWARSVIAGLVLLGITSFVMLGVTAIMRFREGWGGSLPLFNYIGPKVWAAALLQRNIGAAPGEWGVRATQFGLASGVAIWLITLPRPATRYLEAALSLRKLCRWLTLIALGGMLGMLLSESAIFAWETDARNLCYLLLLALVELPAATLLYLYLRQLGISIHDKALAHSLMVLSLAVPACIGGAVGMILVGEMWAGPKQVVLQQALVAGFGAICVALGAFGLSTTTRLCLALLPTALPTLQRRDHLAGAFEVGRRMRRRIADINVRWLGVGIALVALTLLSFLLTAQTLRFGFRTGYGGNWPMLNVPGVKVWAVPLALRFDLASWDEGLMTGAMLCFASINAVWLLTLRVEPDTHRISLRRMTRWVSAILFGIAMAAIVGAGSDGASSLVQSLNATTRASAYTLPLTMFVEAPATLLLFLYLGHLAHQLARPALSRRLVWVGIATVTLIVLGNAFFAASRYGPPSFWRNADWPLLPITLYGIAAVTVAVWGVWSVMTLAGVAFRRAATP